MANKELKVSFPAKISCADNCVCNACHHIGGVVKLELPETQYNRDGILKTKYSNYWICLNCREKLIELLFDCVSENLTFQQKSSDRLTMEIHHGDIADHLIANDVVPVVRCKNCVHRKEKVCCNPSAGMWVGVELKDNDFCSYGERRE